MGNGKIINHALEKLIVKVAVFISYFGSSMNGVNFVRLDELIAMPNIGYRKDEEFEIGCRPKFDLMLWYRGRKSYSVSNRKCKRWDATVYKNRFAFVFGSPISEAHNFCRNPDLSPCGPWCFLESDSSSSYKYLREPCFLTCYDEKYLNRPAPCIPNSSWPLSTNSAKKHDKRLHSQVLSCTRIIYVLNSFT